MEYLWWYYTCGCVSCIGIYVYQPYLIVVCLLKCQYERHITLLPTNNRRLLSYDIYSIDFVFFFFVHFPIFSLELAILRAEASNVYFMNKTIDYKGVRLSGGEGTSKKCAKNIFFVAYFQQKKMILFVNWIQKLTWEPRWMPYRMFPIHQTSF